MKCSMALVEKRRDVMRTAILDSLVPGMSEILSALSKPPSATCLRVCTTRIGRKDFCQVLLQHVTDSSKILCHPSLEDCVLVVGEGPAELPVWDGSLDQLVVDRVCGEAVVKGSNVFTPGVIACDSTLRAGAVVEVWAQIDSTSTFLRGSSLPNHGSTTVPPKGCVRVGRGRAEMSRQCIFKEARGLAVSMTHTEHRFIDFNGKLPGLCQLQGLPSLAAAHAVQAQKGDRVLDMCAAPGGKSSAIAQHMNDTGEVIALDRSHAKVADIRALADSLGLKSIQPLKFDATSVGKIPQTGSQGEKLGPKGGISKPPSQKEVDRLERKRKNAEKRGTSVNPKKAKMSHTEAEKTGSAVSSLLESGSFDRVLLDAPCSALGLKPRLGWGDIGTKELFLHAAYQRRLIDGAVRMLKPGGRLVYSTCTVNPLENECVVAYTLRQHKCMRLVPCLRPQQMDTLGTAGMEGSITDPARLAAMVRPELNEMSNDEILNLIQGTPRQGSTGSHGAAASGWLTPEEAGMVRRFDPRGDHSGFFIAAFVKVTSAGAP